MERGRTQAISGASFGRCLEVKRKGNPPQVAVLATFEDNWSVEMPKRLGSEGPSFCRRVLHCRFGRTYNPHLEQIDY